MVSDDEILAAQKIMAAEAGIFGEPASAAPLAGLIKLTGQETNFSGKVIVCVVTGTGLKDTETAVRQAPPFTEVPAELAAVEKALGWG
jgi:threonine synthase